MEQDIINILYCCECNKILSRNECKCLEFDKFHSKWICIECYEKTKKGDK